MNMASRTLLASLFSAVLLGPVATQAADTPLNLSLGSVAATSGVYAFSVGLSNTVHKMDPAINVTAVEGGGGFDHAKLMKKGVLDLSVSGSPAVAQAVANGTGGFAKEGAWEPVRLMFMRNVNVARVYVRADKAAEHGIRSWSDLKGMSFAPGTPGTRDMQRAMDANALIGDAITMLPGSLDDSTAKLKEGAVAGMLKGSPHDRFDSAMLAVHQGTPLVVVGFSPEQADALKAKDPMNTFTTTPANGIREFGESGPLLEMSSAVMVMSSSRLSQADGYRVAKAAVDGWADINAAFEPTKGLDPLVDAFKQTPKVDGVKFHAGVIQLAVECGIAVPDYLIPAEYVPVK
jgi:TRAP-type uncharacterized transport system substrate-binding protein